MAQVKRKGEHENGVRTKRIKQEEDAEIKPPVKHKSKIAETETDSEPIVESETTSQSGNDDGVSWPSEDGADHDNEWDGVDGGSDDQEDGGLRIAMEAAGIQSPGSELKTQPDRMLYMSHELSNRTSLIDQSTQITRISRKAESGYQRAKSIETQRRFNSALEEAVGEVTPQIPRATPRAKGADRRAFRYNHRSCQGLCVQA